jgi:hypothetical protein
LAGDGCRSDGRAQAILSGQESAAAQVAIAMGTALSLFGRGLPTGNSPATR